MALFVVQKHYARRLHYDFRIEVEGILRSWAIPKIPPLEAGIKRLAVPTGDHELAYADFEGEIPEGVYGAGMVEIWDRGEVELDEREDDKLVFHLKGEKLRGRYCMVRLKDSENWLFFRS